MPKFTGTADEFQTKNSLTWEQHIGLDLTRDAVASHIVQGSLPQVILFEGRVGLGKSTLLPMLAALHFCETTNACGKCTPCLWVKAQEHPDIFVLNSNHSPVKLDEVKEIVPHLNTHPSPGNTNQTHARKVVCIVDAENLTVQAMNFLLKTIEEPPPYAQIYLSTSKKQHLLTTLLSRCVQWPIQPPSKDAIMQLLKKQQIAALQNLGEAQLLDLIRRSGSTPGATLKGLEAMTGGELKEEKEVRKLLLSNRSDEALNHAEKIIQQKKWATSELIAAVEHNLNELYKLDLSHNKPKGEAERKTMFNRRQFLRELKAQLKGRNLHLNTQLICEKIGLLSLTERSSNTQINP